MDLIQGDYGFDLNFTITDSNSSALDLTNSSIKFKMAKVGASTSTVDGTCTIDDASSGTCHYTVQSGDLSETGSYKWEVEVTYTGKIVTAKQAEGIIILAEKP